MLLRALAMTLNTDGLGEEPRVLVWTAATSWMRTRSVGATGALETLVG